MLAVFFGGGGDEEKFKKMPRECMRKREGELIVPSRVCLQCTQDILIAAGEKKKKHTEDKSNLLLINKPKIEANTEADKFGKI